MKLSVQIKLRPTSEQYQLLLRTIEIANIVCNDIANTAFIHHVFGRSGLHKLTYYDIRSRFGLSSQTTIRCIAKVVDSYTVDKKVRHKFKSTGAIAFDDRNLRFRISNSEISILTINGRQTIHYICSEHQRVQLQYQKGESDLIYRNHQFYLSVTCDIPEAEPIIPQDWLGVDLGVVNIAVDSDGSTFSGGKINNIRKRNRRLRTKLQSKGTKSAKRLLKKRSRKERDFAKDINHCISKTIVDKAKDTKRAIALEDLTGIRSRTTVTKSRRATHGSWAFLQLRSMIEYKARMAGIPVVMVDPRNTSRECPVCGCIDKRNRVTQSHFSCISCGYAGLADYIAATNVRRRAIVNSPYAAVS